MKNIRSVVGASLLALCASVQSASAQNILYYTDSNEGTSTIPGALTLLQAIRPTVVFTEATSDADFNTQLGATSWDLVIFGQQNQGFPFETAGASLTAYLNNGGRILGANWLDDGYTALMGLTIASQNGTSISGVGPLFAGITSPLGVFDPGWGVYSQGYNGASECLATLDSGGCAAALDNGGRTLMLAPLFDSYPVQADGERFVANSADYLLGARTTVPEPSTYALMAAGLASVFGVARRRRA